MGIVSLLCCIVCCAVSGCCAAVTRRTEQQRTALEPIPERVCHSATPPIVTFPFPRLSGQRSHAALLWSHALLWLVTCH